MRYMQKLYNKKMNRNADLVLDDYLVKVFQDKKKPSPKEVAAKEINLSFTLQDMYKVG